MSLSTHMRNKDKTLLKTAFLFAEESYCNRLKVGAVIAKDTRIISTGYNGTISGMDNCCEDKDDRTKRTVLHAEQNALMFALRNGTSTLGTTMYITHSPCEDCAKLIAQSGIAKVIYSEDYRDLNGVKFLQEANVKVEQLNLKEENYE